MTAPTPEATRQRMAGGAVDAVDAADISRTHLLARLEIVEERVRAAVERRRADDPDPTDRFRGLYISDAQVDGLLSAPLEPMLPEPAAGASIERLAALEADADAAEAAGADLRLRRLARSFGLDPYDVELLLIALAPDLDPRFERLYGYLHDDVSRRRASAGLALELCGKAASPGASAGRVRLGPLGPLVASGLLVVEDPDRPFLTRSLRVPDRVAAHLLGDDSVDPAIRGLVADSIAAGIGDVELLARALEGGVPLVYIRERPGASGHSLARSAMERLGRPVVELDLTRLGPGEEPRALAAATAREAGLRGAGVVVGPIEPLAEIGAAAVRAFAEARPGAVLIGSRGWDPNWAREAPLLLDAPVATVAERHEMWLSSLNGEAPPDFDPAIVTVAFRLGPDQIKRAGQAARRAATAASRPMTVADVSSGARAQNAAGLERLARRIEPAVGWPDLVLPPTVEAQLRELTARARHRDTVVGEWGMGLRGSRARGITGLFAGDSGTGKTMSAEVVAHDLDFDLYVIDLSTVVDKYIGETEKNLDRIFTEADRVNGVLLFDEADALFGKRSEVKDARDRYANVEVAYLLQRMESFDGVAILTTNLRANVDEAFIRRLDAIVDFPLPEHDHRLLLWGRNLPAGVPRADDVDLEFLARRFKLSGGDIRNICVAAAYLAAAGA
ncbi:MAG TPA: ATP-binding protein, partial [Candidatus Limnocylindrales bacterium]|nr:ATP-binding protein [Candidatus Limnocylindrales bacterium]